MSDASLLPFDLPAVARKKVSAAVEGGLISSDGGLVLLREAERSLRLAESLAGCIRDRRNQAQVVHSRSAMLRFRMLAIACGGACPRAGEAGPVGGWRRLRRAPRRPAVQAGLRQGAGGRPRPVFSADHEPPGERAVPHRGGAHDGGAGRSLLPQLRGPSRRHHARHRRHLRCRARPPAALALPRPLRHALLPARSRLSRGKRQAGGGSPAPGQDAVGARGPHSHQAPGRPYLRCLGKNLPPAILAGGLGPEHGKA